MWDLGVGKKIKRTELHERFGGRGQGGIGPSSRSRTCSCFQKRSLVNPTAISTAGGRMAASTTRAKGRKAIS